MEGFNEEQVRQLREIVGGAMRPLEGRIDNLETRMENGFAAIAEDIADVKESVDKLTDRVTAVESKIGGIHARIDQEAAQRKNLESRVRAVLPNLPPAPELV